MNEHPTHDDLAAFLEGRLPEDQIPLLEAWLEQNPQGIAALEALADVANFPGDAVHKLSVADASADALLAKLRAADFSLSNVADRVLSALEPHPSKPELKLLGNFEVRSVIGTGGMGAVLEGWDEALQRPVALKMTLPQDVHDPKSGKQIWAEAQLIAGLDHANIVPVFSVHQHAGGVFFVMPLVESETLESFVKKRGQLSEAETLRLAAQAAEALAYAHQKGVVHRDIKPSNLLIQQDRLRVADFGISAALGAATSGSGTPDYMPPEQCAGQLANASADIYALGATLYFCRTGQIYQKGTPMPKGWMSGPLKQMLAENPLQRPTAGQIHALFAQRPIQLKRRKMIASVLLVSAACLGLFFALGPLGATNWVNHLRAQYTDAKFSVDGRFGNYRNLADAAKASGGRRILANFDGEMGMRVTDFGSMAVTIIAAPNRQPIFRQDQPTSPLLIAKSPLTLENITLLRPAHKEPVHKALVQVINAPLALKNCRLVAQQGPQMGRGDVLRITGYGSLTLTQSSIDAPNSPWLAVKRFRENPQVPPVTITVSDSNISASHFMLEPSPGMLINLGITNSKLSQRFALVLQLHGTERINVNSTRSIYEFSDSLVWLSKYPAPLGKIVTWSSQGDAYLPQPNADFVRFAAGAQQAPIATESAWREALDER